VAKPDPREIEALYQEGADAGLTRVEVDVIALPHLARRMGQEPTAASQIGSRRELSTVRGALAAEIGRRQRATAAGQPRATARQVDYLVDLLVARARAGDGGGLVGCARFYADDGSVDTARVAALTRTEASQLITSLTDS